MKKSFVVQFTIETDIQDNKEIYDIIKNINEAVSNKKVEGVERMIGGSIMHVFDTREN